jgi:hypothetical protein
MPLVIEDGTQVAGANSYTDLANARLIAGQFGLELDTDDTAAENNLIVAYNWLNTLESEFQGARLSDQDTNTNQTGVYPRSPVYLRGNLIGANVIPLELIQAQVVASHGNQSGNILTPEIPTTGAVTREKLDGVGEIQYKEGYAPSGDNANSSLVFANSLLSPLLKSALGITGSGLTLVKGYS